MACDICGNNRDQLTDLLPAYRTADIAQICPGCEKTINKHHSKLQTMLIGRMLPELLQRFMRGRKRESNAGGTDA